MNTIPRLSKKANRSVDPDSLAAALNWDKISNPENEAEPEEEGDAPDKGEEEGGDE